MDMFLSTGILQYSTNPYKLIVLIDQNIIDYYRSLFPKYIEKPSRQKYPAHISVVRKEIPKNIDLWEKYEGKEIEFFYSPIIQQNNIYYWLNVFSVPLEEIRLELGLVVDSLFFQPPNGFKKTFHITIGNTKKHE